MTTAERYRVFAEVEAAGSSPKYEAFSLAVSECTPLIELLDSLPTPKRQPNLLFATCQFLGATFEESEETLSFAIQNWQDIASVMQQRSTQTNECARAATFLPMLAQLPQPLSLIEVGASGGLCLYPDRFSIRYGDAPAVGPADSPVALNVEVLGPVPVPKSEISVMSRTGIDLNPLDVSKPDDLAWLVACVWPEHEERRNRLYAAAQIVTSEPPEMHKSDLVECIDEVLDAVPRGSTPVVFHSAVLNYVDPERRTEFARRMRSHQTAIWISNEGPGVVTGLDVSAPVPAHANPNNCFVVGLNGEEAIAISDPHGKWLSWLR